VTAAERKHAHRTRPVETVRGIRALLANPDDTSQVFRIIRAASGRSFERLFHRVKQDPAGARILAEQRMLLGALSDRERLRGLADGSLGREYARFMDAEQISADGLAEASLPDQPQDPSPLGPEAEVLGERLRDMHDLWHVTTGYGRDLLGEVALLAFSYAQTCNRGIGIIVGVALYKMWRGGANEAVELVRGGYRRGRKARLLPAADWEALLELPLNQVRLQLEVEPAPSYTQDRSTGAPPVANAAA
jgi:ubiquinone biosynthesis protein COQ4